MKEKWYRLIKLEFSKASYRSRWLFIKTFTFLYWVTLSWEVTWEQHFWKATHMILMLRMGSPALGLAHIYYSKLEGEFLCLSCIKREAVRVIWAHSVKCESESSLDLIMSAKCGGHWCCSRSRHRIAHFPALCCWVGLSDKFLL